MPKREKVRVEQQMQNGAFALVTLIMSGTYSSTSAYAEESTRHRQLTYLPEIETCVFAIDTADDPDNILDYFSGTVDGEYWFAGYGDRGIGFPIIVGPSRVYQRSIGAIEKKLDNPYYLLFEDREGNPVPSAFRGQETLDRGQDDERCGAELIAELKTTFRPG